jgi:hypothetical protein
MTFPARADVMEWEALVWLRAENRIVRAAQGEAVSYFDLSRTVPAGHWSDVAASMRGRYLVHSAFNHETRRFYHTVYDARSGALLVDFSNEGGLGSGPRLFGAMVDETASQVAFATIVSALVPQESEILIFDLVPGQRRSQPTHRLTSAELPALRLVTPVVPIVGRLWGGDVSFFLYADAGAGSVVDGPYRWRSTSGEVTADALYQPPVVVSEQPPEVLRTYLTFAQQPHPSTGEVLHGGRDVQIVSPVTGERTTVFRGDENTVSVGRFIQGGARIVIITRDEEQVIRNEMGDYTAAPSLVIRVVDREGRVQFEQRYAPDALPYGCAQPLLLTHFSATGFYYLCEQDSATAIYHHNTRTTISTDSLATATPLYVTTAPDPEAVVVWVGDKTPMRP